MTGSFFKRNATGGRRWIRYLAAFLICTFLWNIQYIYNLLEPRKGVRYFDTSILDNSIQVQQTEILNQNEGKTSKTENDQHQEAIDIYDREPMVSTINITGEGALDAIGRANTDKCRRQLIENAFQKEHTPAVLTPVSLPRSCPLAEPLKYGEYLGCYADYPRDRLLKGGEFTLKDTNSIENCINNCVRVGQQLAGVQYGEECFCGSKKSLTKILRLTNDDGPCKAYKCPGNETQFCGGYKLMAIYETGVGRKCPINPHHVPLEEKLENPDPVKIVFLLQFNGRSTRQVKRMLKLLYRRKHFYYVHVDKRQSYMYREMLALEKTLPNLKVKRNRFSSIWGGASLLSMILDAFKDLLGEFRFWPWEYVINLSEADMPLVSVDTVEKFLRKHRGSNFMRSHGNGTASFVRKQGLDQIFSECDNHMYRLGKRQLPINIRYDGGSDWFALHRRFIQFAIHGSEKADEQKLIDGLKKMFETVLLPAESFFHTLALNSQYCTTVADTNLKLTNWRRKQGCKCQYKHIVDWCGCSPNVIRTDDWDRLEHPAIFKRLDYFARKFDAIIDQNVIRRVEEQIHEQERQMADAVAEAARADEAAPKHVEEEVSTNKKSNEDEEILGFHAYWENQYDIIDESMEKLKSSNYATWVLLKSLGRSALKYLFKKFYPNADHPKGNDNTNADGTRCHNRCDRLETIERMHVYYEADVFEGLLVQFNGTCSALESGDGGGKWSLEAFVKRITNTTKFQTKNALATALVTLEVGTKFDVKEEIFRNYAGAMAVDEPIAIRHQWDKSILEDIDYKDRKVDIIFLDPDGNTRGSYVQKLENPTGYEYTKLPITKSYELESGVWKVQLRSHGGGAVIAETYFPLLPADKEQINDQDIKYVDQLISQFYQIEFICRANNQDQSASTNMDDCERLFLLTDNEVNTTGGYEEKTKKEDGHVGVPLCKRTYWSSLSPDPKSEINGFNWKTGTILPR